MKLPARLSTHAEATRPKQFYGPVFQGKEDPCVMQIVLERRKIGKVTSTHFVKKVELNKERTRKLKSNLKNIDAKILIITTLNPLLY